MPSAGKTNRDSDVKDVGMLWERKVSHAEAVEQIIIEPRCEKTGLRGFRPGQIQTRLYNHSRWLEA